MEEVFSQRGVEARMRWEEVLRGENALTDEESSIIIDGMQATTVGQD